MSFATIIFGLVFLIPLIVFFLYFIVWQDKKTQVIGTIVLAAMILLGVAVAIYINRGF